MFGNGKGLFGGGAMASGPMRKPEKERGPFDSTTGKLAMLGDLLLRAGGRGGNPMVAHMQRQQMMDRQVQMAKQQREWGLEDFAAQEQIRAQYASPGEPYRWRDNAGNLMEMGPDGQARAAYIDPGDRYNVQGDQAVRIPNPLRGGGGTPRRPQVGEEVNGHIYLGGDLNNPQSWRQAAGGTAPSGGGFRR